MLNLIDVCVPISKETYSNLISLPKEELSKQIYQIAEDSGYTPESVGCLSREIKQEGDNYYAMWKIKELN